MHVSGEQHISNHKGLHMPCCTPRVSPEGSGSFKAVRQGSLTLPVALGHLQMTDLAGARLEAWRPVTQAIAMVIEMQLLEPPARFLREDVGRSLSTAG